MARRRKITVIQLLTMRGRPLPQPCGYEDEDGWHLALDYHCFTPRNARNTIRHIKCRLAKWRPALEVANATDVTIARDGSEVRVLFNCTNKMTPIQGASPC